MNDKTANGRGATPAYDIVIVGAGFAGLYMLHRARILGFTARVLEAGDGVGGTWYWNRYPGARCDVESMEYSYQFSDELQQEWDWSERYAAQPEILDYANHVADRFDLRRDIQFETRVVSASFDETAGTWTIRTDAADAITARYCVMATGCLSSANKPPFKGLDEFEGETFHTGQWPHEPVDFTDRRVAVIGTGSSAIQSIPVIAERAAHLTVFQRTPNFAVPARNRPLEPEEIAEIKANYAAFREHCRTTRNGTKYAVNDVSALAVSARERERQYRAKWENGGLCFMTSFNDLLLDSEANETARAFLRARIAEIVEDPEVADLLSPTSVVGCKRLCVDTDYFATYNRDNVALVDVSKTLVEAITARGVVVDGKTYAVDAIVFATGFDAMTGTLNKIAITGRNGQSLKDKWAEGPRAYLGIAIAGFPNLFTVTGPGSPSVLTNMLPSIEHHVELICDMIVHARKAGRTIIEARQDAEDAWVEHTNTVAGRTLYPTCNSWYLGANVAGKPRVFMPYVGFPAYLARCKEIAANGYEGFALD
jgi:cyclohexanone monooxygenase